MDTALCPRVRGSTACLHTLGGRPRSQLDRFGQSLFVLTRNQRLLTSMPLGVAVPAGSNDVVGGVPSPLATSMEVLRRTFVELCCSGLTPRSKAKGLLPT